MDFQFLDGLAPGVIAMINGAFGTNIDPAWGTPFALGISLPFVLLAGYASVRKGVTTVHRFWAATPVLDDDGRAVVQHVRDDLAELKDGIKEDSEAVIDPLRNSLETLQQHVRSASRGQQSGELKSLLAMIASRLGQTSELMRADPDEPKGSPKLNKQGRLQRRIMVGLVRETVLSNLWSGNYFDETRRERHVYRTMFEDGHRKVVTIHVRTPFAASSLAPDVLPYGIDIRYDTRMVLKIEWDPYDHDRILINRSERGDWEDAILSWNVSQAYVPKVHDAENVEQLEVRGSA